MRALALLALLALAASPARAAAAPVNVVAEVAGTPGRPAVAIWAHSAAAPGTPARLRLDLAPPLRLAAVAFADVEPACALRADAPQWLSCELPLPPGGAVAALALLDGGPFCAGGAAVTARVFADGAEGMARVFVPLPALACHYLPIVEAP